MYTSAVLRQPEFQKLPRRYLKLICEQPGLNVSEVCSFLAPCLCASISSHAIVFIPRRLRCGMRWWSGRRRTVRCKDARPTRRICGAYSATCGIAAALTDLSVGLCCQASAGRRGQVHSLPCDVHDGCRGQGEGFASATKPVLVQCCQSLLLMAASLCSFPCAAQVTPTNILSPEQNLKLYQFLGSSAEEQKCGR